MLDKMRMFFFCSHPIAESSNPEEGSFMLNVGKSEISIGISELSALENFSVIAVSTIIHLDNGDKLEIFLCVFPR